MSPSPPPRASLARRLGSSLGPVSPETAAAAVRDRQLAVRWGLLLIPALYPLDAFFAGHAIPEALVVRALWAGIFVLGLGRQSRDGHDGDGRWVMVYAIASATAIFALAALTGGKDSYLFPWTFALPVIFGAVNPDRRQAVVGSAVILALGGAAILSQTTHPGLGITLYVAQLGVVTGLALVAQSQFSRLVTRELSAAGEREAALAALVESESRRARSERLATLGQLAAGVAHEINNPLAYLKANLGYIRELSLEQLPPADREDVAEVLDESRTGLERIAEIVGALRLYARDDEETLSGDVSGAVAEAAQLASVRLRGVAELDTEVLPGLPAVPMSQGRLAQVLVNLLLNAADAVVDRPGAGWVSLRAEAVKGGERVRITVEDDGVGLTPDVKARLFRPFFTTKPPGQGTGLGLALAEEMVGRAGGTVGASDRPDGPGARFVVELPALPQARSTGSSSAA